MRASLMISLGLGLLFCLVTDAAAQSLRKDYSDDALVQILKDDGYTSVQIDEPRSLKIKIDGITYYLFVYDDGDLQLYFGLTGYTLTIADMNDWNREHRLTRAYLDGDNDPVLEADLLANAGYSDAQLIEFVAVFDQLARQFRGFIDDRDSATPTAEPAAEFERI